MAKPVPFEFVIERLDRLNPAIRPMFGCHAVYANNKIILAFRKKDEGTYDNGIWVATSKEHHTSLKKDFPSLRSIKVLGAAVTGWQNIPEDADDFEESALKLCDLVLKNDPRIGKIPKAKKAGKKTRD